jgi:enoyl-CoA hydratase
VGGSGLLSGLPSGTRRWHREATIIGPYDYFDIDVAERIATVTINRPSARNALTAAMRRDFAALFEALDESEDVDVVVLTGADPAFCSGVDLKDRLADGTVPPRVEPNPAAVLRTMRLPVIAAVNGACVTGGLEMALSCSFAIASDRARFGDTHAKVGILPGWGLSALLPAAVGLWRARELSFTGRILDAQDAAAYGLVNRVVPHETLLGEARHAATGVTGCHQGAVRALVSLYESARGLPFGEALQRERAAADAWRTDPQAAAARFGQLTDRQQKESR